MPKVKLTDAVVAKAELPPGRRDIVLWDSEVTGFGLRVRAQSKTYILMYRPVGAGRTQNSKRLKIGTPGTIETTSEARRIARTQLGQVAAGADPAAERAEMKRRDKARIEDLLDRYETYNRARRYVDLKGTMSVLRRNLKPLFNRDAKSIAGSEIVAIRTRLTAAGLEGAADNFWARCRAFFSWCLSTEKVIDTHPIFSHRKEKRTRADRIALEEHGRALSDDELMKVWFAAPDTTFGRYLRFLILSSCRRTEASKVRRAMEKLDQARRSVLVIPKTITKSGRDHNMPVTPQIQDLFRRCELDSRSDLYFPSWKTGRPMQGWAKMLAPIVERSGIDFDLHDLRRTFRTGLSRLGVEADVAEICINHGRRGLERVYNRNSAGSEMRDAYELWSTHVDMLVRKKQATMRITRGVENNLAQPTNQTTVFQTTSRTEFSKRAKGKAERRSRSRTSIVLPPN